MGCCTNRRKVVEARPEQKWDYINLNDFKSKGCATPFAYGYLWFMLIISIAVYGVDTFTAVNLLVFNKWSGEIDPAIDFEISKWIFSICIIASFVNLGFEQLRAMRVMKRGNIAECYLDNIAVRLESIRLGKRQGYRRFLVFAELTKSKKGGQYIALFTYFSFQSWIRVLLCSGPRQAINALTLKSVYEVKLSSDGGGNVGEEILSFFEKIKELATQDTQQAVILSGMLFTLVVWIFSALFLLAAVLFYVFFLWHWIPRADGGLSGYCERKVNKSLTKIVHEKVDKALAKEERKQLKAGINGVEKPILGRQATLPTLPNLGEPGKLPDMPQLDRKDTMATLPPYTSRPASPGSIELGQMDRKRPLPPRTTTMSSTASYNSNAPLMGNSADMGYATPLPSSNAMAPPNRPGTSNSHRTAGRPPLDPMSAYSSSLRNNITESPSTYSADTMPPLPAPVRSMTGRTFDTYDGGRSSPAPSRPAYGEYTLPSDGRASPAPSIFSDRSAAPSSARAGASSGSFQPYQPGRGATGPVPNRGPGSHYTPSRNMTAPMPPRGENDYFTRPGTSQSHRPNPRGPDRGYDTYNADPESQRDTRLDGPSYKFSLADVMVLLVLRDVRGLKLVMSTPPYQLLTSNTSSNLLQHHLTPDYLAYIHLTMSAATAAPAWHPGELAVHRLLSVPTPHANPTSAVLPRPYAARIAAAPLLALGTLDADGRPWTTLWGGAAGVAGAMGPGLLGVRARVDAAHDPVLRALWGGRVVEQVVRSGDKVVSGLGIDLQTRDRVKLMGRLVAGAVAQGEVQMAVRVEGSLGNCPKYLNGRALVERTPEVEGVEDGFPLSERARRVVDQADLFFLSSGHGTGMDTNHRGGSKGFVRIGRNDEGAVELVYPEYTGNRLYQTLGNLQANPLVGITIPDFDTSDVLYATGAATILTGDAADALLPHTRLAIKITLTSALLVKAGLPMRATSPQVDYSPYNPPARPLAAEGAAALPSTPLATATLQHRQPLTPSITRFTFALDAPRDPVPGEYVTLDFAAELDHGWSHMRDDDPRSLNEDWIRSFTISGYPSARAFEITARVKRGGATELLSKHLLRGGPLEVAVRGFDVTEGTRMGAVAEEEKKEIFFGGGVGITPLLAQAPGLLTGGKAFEVIWGVRGEDVGVVRDAVERIPALAERLRVHVTGKIGEADEETLAKVEALGVRVERRRMEKQDLERVFEGEKRKFYLCAAPALLTIMKGWLENEEVVWEDFGY